MYKLRDLMERYATYLLYISILPLTRSLQDMHKWGEANKNV